MPTSSMAFFFVMCTERADCSHRAGLDVFFDVELVPTLLSLPGPKDDKVFVRPDGFLLHGQNYCAPSKEFKRFGTQVWLSDEFCTKLFELDWVNLSRWKDSP
jgi:hypothetical protein